MIDLRLNHHHNTAGLLGQHTAIFHQDDNNGVIGYHRWQDGGPGDDVLVVANISDHDFTTYQLTLPRSGAWKVRFNSTWSGYSSDFANVSIEHITTDDQSLATISLPAYTVLIVSQE